MANETLLTIASRTGYSTSTISRVLSGQGEKYRISEKTIEAIKTEAKKCNYTPSLLAKGLRTNKTHTIGLLIPTLENPYFAHMAATIISEAKIYGFTMILVSSMEGAANEVDGLRLLMSRKVDGIIAVPSGVGSKHFEKIKEQNIPIILVDRYFEDSDLSYVCTNNYLGALEATKYLIENGHRNIVCIQGPSFQTPVMERVRGFKDAMSSYGINDCAKIVGEDFSIQNGYLETKVLLCSNSRPTAIFALSNTILLGAIKAISESKLKIPEDISVISFDNNIFLDYINPPISRVSQPVQEIGSLALKLVVQQINNTSQQPQPKLQIQLPPKLILCDSVSVNLKATPATMI